MTKQRNVSISMHFSSNFSLLFDYLLKKVETKVQTSLIKKKQSQPSCHYFLSTSSTKVKILNQAIARSKARSTTIYYVDSKIVLSRFKTAECSPHVALMLTWIFWMMSIFVFWHSYKAYMDFFYPNLTLHLHKQKNTHSPNVDLDF